MESSPADAVPGAPRRHLLERGLRLFGDVRAGESLLVLLLTLDVFLVLTAYYLLKVAREPLILLGAGAEVKSYAAVAQSVVLLGVATFYGWLAGRVGRVALISSVTMFFAANLLGFWIAGTQGLQIGVAFFLWLGIFNIVSTTQFWSFAADIYGEAQGKRLFPVIGIGGSLGALAGAALAGPVLRHGSPFALMAAAAAFLVGSLALTLIIHDRASRGAPAHHEAHHPVERGGAFQEIVHDRYLLSIALLILVLNFVTRSGDYLLDRMLLAQAAQKARDLGVTQAAYIGHFKATYFGWTNAIGTAVQLFAVSRVFKYVGVGGAMVLVPLASLGGYGMTLVVPLLGVLATGRVLEGALDYSLSNTAQQTLWLVTARAAKYRAKQVIDSFFKRAGDTASAAVVGIGAHFALSTRSFVAINVALTIAWAALAVVVSRRYAARAATPARPLAPEPAWPTPLFRRPPTIPDRGPP
jgi:AAA family ATP:ADP antiporter